MFIFGKLLDLEKRVAMFEPMIKSFFVENETFKNKVSILTVEVEKDREHVAALEKSLQVEKDFCKLKDKQIDDLELKLQIVGAMVKDFKDSDEYSDELCGYYVEGFDLLMKWMAKHHPDLDLSGLVMDDVEKELLTNPPSEAITKNVTEQTITVANVMEEAATTILADPIPDEQ